jgi:hypothetical protein
MAKYFSKAKASAQCLVSASINGKQTHLTSTMDEPTAHYLGALVGHVKALSSTFDIIAIADKLVLPPPCKLLNPATNLDVVQDENVEHTPTHPLRQKVTSVLLAMVNAHYKHATGYNLSTMQHMLGCIPMLAGPTTMPQHSILDSVADIATASSAYPKERETLVALLAQVRSALPEPSPRVRGTPRGRPVAPAQQPAPDPVALTINNVMGTFDLGTYPAHPAQTHAQAAEHAVAQFLRQVLAANT